MTRALLEQAATILHKHHQHQTRYSRAKCAANATCADFKTSPIAELAESGYMHSIGKETEVLLDAIRAHLAQPQGEPVAWVDPERLDAISSGRAVPATLSGNRIRRFTAALYTHPAHTESPAWHDKPTVPGLWRASSTETLKEINEWNIAAYQRTGVRWYGPIPEDTGGEP